MLKIKHLHKSFNQRTVIKDLSLSVESGDIFGFIGSNGAGKTTTIKSIVGILPFEAGQILIDGHDIQKEPLVCKQHLAYLPDNPDLYDYLTGYQFLNFIADIFEISLENRKIRIAKYAQQFELEAALGDLIVSYSHGMKQKLALISALIHKPKLTYY